MDIVVMVIGGIIGLVGPFGYITICRFRKSSLKTDTIFNFINTGVMVFTIGFMI